MWEREVDLYKRCAYAAKNAYEDHSPDKEQWKYRLMAATVALEKEMEDYLWNPPTYVRPDGKTFSPLKKDDCDTVNYIRAWMRANAKAGMPPMKWKFQQWDASPIDDCDTVYICVGARFDMGESLGGESYDYVDNTLGDLSLMEGEIDRTNDYAKAQKWVDDQLQMLNFHGHELEKTNDFELGQ